MAGDRGLATGIPTRLTSPATEARELRRFGLLVGAIFAAIAIWPVAFRGELPRSWALILAGSLIAIGLAAPRALRPVQRWWMRLGHALGWVNTRLLLGTVYFLVLTPIGAAMRLIGRDPLDRRLGDRASYWKPRGPTRDSKRSMELRF